MKTHVLLIDDCPNISLMLKVIIERYFQNDIRLSTAPTLQAGLEKLEADEPDIVLLDYSLTPDSDCGRSIADIRSSSFDGPIHLWSNHDRSVVTRHPSTKYVTSISQKQDYIGLQLRTLVEERFCRPVRDTDCEHYAPYNPTCQTCLSA